MTVAASVAADSREDMSIPFPKSRDHMVGRDSLMEEISTSFCNEGCKFRRVVLYGDDGAGKTTLALAIAHMGKMKDKFPIQFFMEGSSLAVFRKELVSLAVRSHFGDLEQDKMDPGELDEEKEKEREENSVQEARQYFSKINTPWLLIVDDVSRVTSDDMIDIIELLPTNKKGKPCGHVLLTTRQDCQLWPEEKQMGLTGKHEVSALSVQEAKELLMEGNDGVVEDVVIDATANIGDYLSDVLGNEEGRVLAIDAKLLKRALRDKSVEDARAVMDKWKAKIAGSLGSKRADHHRVIGRQMAVSELMDGLENEWEGRNDVVVSAKALLTILVVLNAAGAGVPNSLFVSRKKPAVSECLSDESIPSTSVTEVDIHWKGKETPTLALATKALFENEKLVQEARQALENIGLVSYVDSKGVMRMHSIIQYSVQEELLPALMKVDPSLLPWEVLSDALMSKLEDVLQAGKEVMTAAGSNRDDHESDLVVILAESLCSKELLQPSSQKALALAIAKTHEAKNRYEAALPFYKRALELLEDGHGPDNPDTVDVRSSICSLLKSLKQYGDALPYYKKTLELREQQQSSDGANNSAIVEALSELSDCYELMEDYDEAISINKRILQIKKEALATATTDHPDIANCLIDIGALYKVTECYDDALPLYKQAVVMNEKMLGVDHPETADSLLELTLLYKLMEKFDDALPLCQRALAIYEKQQPSSSSPSDQGRISSCMSCLGSVYEAMENYDDAVAIYTRVLAMREKTYGVNHPDVADSLNDLGDCYEAMDEDDKALPLYQRALEIREKALGPGHVLTGESLGSLASLYESLERYQEAVDLYERALAIAKKQLGNNHLNVANILIDLADCLESVEELDNAIAACTRALQIREEKLRLDHPDIAKCLISLGSLYKATARYRDALPLYMRALEIRENELDPDDPEIPSTMSDVAGIYKLMARYEDALPLYQKVLKLREEDDPDDSETGETLYDLAGLLKLMERYEEALPLYLRALKIQEEEQEEDVGDDLEVVPLLNDLADLYQRMERHSDALSVMQRVLTIREKELDPDDLDIGRTLWDIAVVMQSLDRKEESMQYYRRAVSIRDKHPPQEEGED